MIPDLHPVMWVALLPLALLALILAAYAFGATGLDRLVTKSFERERITLLASAREWWDRYEELGGPKAKTQDAAVAIMDRTTADLAAKRAAAKPVRGYEWTMRALPAVVARVLRPDRTVGK